MTEAHPLRCETCSHYGGHICYSQHNRMSNIELTLIEMVGCASHSSAKESSDVLEELVKWLEYETSRYRNAYFTQVLEHIVELRQQKER